MSVPVEAVDQLKFIIRSWEPHERIDIRGVIIDYCQRTGLTLHDVFVENFEIYKALFIDKKIKQVECLSMLLANEAVTDAAFEQKYLSTFPMTLDLLSRGGGGSVPRSASNPPDDSFKDMVTKELLAKSHKIWQLSDIHFGKLNNRGDDPSALAASLIYTVGMNPEVAPDYIFVSGDISSIGISKEFEQFKVFVDKLSEGLWGKCSPHRVFLVPGNHEVCWGKDGLADQLKGFREHFCDDKYCITPFGSATAEFASPNIKVSRYGVDGDDSTPFAVVRMEDVGINLVLLVSSTHSGQIKPEVKELVDSGIDDHGLKDKLMNILRVDGGDITMQYLSLIAKHLDADEGYPNIAVMHHHPHAYGSEVSNNRLGFALLETLWKKNCKLLFHGHIHMFESNKKQVRAVQPGFAYGIPCSTFSSHTLVNSPGFMIHAIQKESPQKIATFRWEMSAESIFSEEHMKLSYLSTFQPSGLSVERY